MKNVKVVNKNGRDIIDRFIEMDLTGTKKRCRRGTKNKVSAGKKYLYWFSALLYIAIALIAII